MDCDLMMISGQVKKIQLEMLEGLTGVLDALMELKQESELLSEYWKGAAAESFFKALCIEWENACTLTDKVLEGVGELQILESKLAGRESRIRQEIVKGGGAELWMM